MITKALHDFCLWLDQTPMSQTIQTVNWILPAVQTVHILAIAAVMGSVLMIHLRLVGALGRDQPLPRFSTRFLPVIWWVLPVLLASGSIMIIGEPLRSLENPIFQLKICLVLAAIAITLGFQIPLGKDHSFWESSVGRRRASWLLAVLSLAIWVGIVLAGRWIAYY